MNKKWELKILNAHAQHRAWSKHHVLEAIFALAISAFLIAPQAAFAQDVQQQTAASDAAAQAQHVDAPPTAQPAVNVNAVNIVSQVLKNTVKTPVNAQAPSAAQAPTQAPSAAQAPAASSEQKATQTDTKATTATAQQDPQPAAGNPQPQQPTQQLDPAKYKDALGTDLNFDWNKDGKTTAEDWLAFRKWLSDFKPLKPDADGTPENSEGGNTALGAVKIITGVSDSGDQKLDNNLDVSKIKQYYLQNVGQLTPPRNQDAAGTCWVHAIMSELESAILKKKQGDGGKALDEVKHKSPLLANIPDDVDLSELYFELKSFTPEKQGSQKGEGAEQIDDKTGKVAPVADSMNLGGFTDFDENTLTNWEGVVSEKTEPYWPKKAPGFEDNLDNRIKYLLGLIDSDEFWDTKNWGYHDEAAAAKEKPVAHVDGVYYLPAFNHYKLDGKGNMDWVSRNDKARLRVKEALVKYGAVQVSLNADKLFYLTYVYDDGDKTVQNHAVSIVGWDDDMPADKFKGFQKGTKPAGNGAWLIKNSWGSQSNKAAAFKKLQAQYHLSDEQLKEKIKALLDTKGTKERAKRTVESYADAAQKVKELENKIKATQTPAQADLDELEEYKKQAEEYKQAKENFDEYYKKFLQEKVDDTLSGKDAGWGLPDKDGNPSGFFWISYYDHSLTGAQALSVDIADDGFDYDNVYTYNYTKTGTDNPFALRTQGSDTAVANVFTAKGTEILKAVSVRSQLAGTKVNIKVYLVTDEGLKDLDPTNDSSVVSEQNYVTEAAGFETVKLNTPVQLYKGQKFAVVETVVSTDAQGKDYSWLNVETGLSQSAQDPNPNEKKNADGLLNKGLPMQYIWTHVKSNPGETFIRLQTKDGLKWVTPAALTKAISDGDAFEFGNALIKAFTVNGVLPATLTPAQPIVDTACDDQSDISVNQSAVHTASDNQPQASVNQSAVHTASDDQSGTQGDVSAKQSKTPKTSDLAGSGAGVLGGLGALFSLAGAFVSRKLNKR